MSRRLARTHRNHGLPKLPADVRLYRRTPEFTEETVPDGLRKAHRTKAGVWGRIVVLEGRIRYRVIRARVADRLLDPGNPGIVEPGVEHEVEPLGNARFFVEFHR